MAVFDKFKQLLDAVRNTFTAVEAKRDLQKEAVEYGLYMRTRIQAAAPRGDRWTDPPEVYAKRERFPAIRSPRPSLRQHGVTLYNSFGQPFLTSETNLHGSRPVVEVEIPSSAPHAEVVQTGAKPHNIPFNPFIRKLFYHHFRDGITRFDDIVGHKGHSGNPFVSETYLKEQSYTERRFDAFIGRVIFRPIEGLFE